MSYRSKWLYFFLVGPILFMILYSVIISIAVAAGYSLYADNYNSHMGVVTMIEGAVGIGVMTVVLLIKRYMIWPRPRWAVGKPYDWAFALLGSMAMLGVSIAYMNLVDMIKLDAVQKALEQYTEMIEVASVSKTDLYLQFFALVILIPILEEMIFRGVILAGMMELNRPYLAVFGSAVFFGAMHVQPIQVGYAILSGVILGLIYYYTQNLCMTILSHMVFNFFGNGMFLIFDIPDRVGTTLSWVQMGLIPCFFVAAYFMAKKRRERFPGKEAETGDFNKDLPGRHT